MESDEEFSNADSLPSQNSNSASFQHSGGLLGNLDVASEHPNNVSPNASNVRRSASGVLRCDEMSEASPAQQACFRGEFETDSIFHEDTDPFDG